MVNVGIIAEYNPFHNGHIFHIEKIKEMFPESSITLVLSSSFTQRGTPSILNKWDKTKLSLQYGVDLVIELPFPFSTQSADIFAKIAIEILKEVKCDYLVFGSEENNALKLKELASIQLSSPRFDLLVKKYLKDGVNYPTAMNLALKEIGNEEVTTPNDLLGLSYVKEILRQKAKIEPITILRTSSYHDNEIRGEITSATSIREALKKKEKVDDCVPKEVIECLENHSVFFEDYFHLFKYKVYSSPDLSIFLDVDEGIENRILKVIDECSSIQEFMERIKTKRYTYNKLGRMITHILTGYTKEENKNYQHVSYLRILGFSNKGKEILKNIKKTSTLPIYTKFQKDVPGLQLEKRITAIYASVLNKEKQKEFIMMEYQNKPVQKEE